LSSANGHAPTAPELLEAPNILEYPYSRSTGPVIGAFMTALRDGKIIGGKSPSGQVIVPPTEYDPQTSEAISELVDVGSAGVVTTWAWVRQPRAKHPMSEPFAWALVKLDGADTAMLHVVKAVGPDAMRSGMRVVAKFKDEREGHIKDIECFIAEEGK